MAASRRESRLPRLSDADDALTGRRYWDLNGENEMTDVIIVIVGLQPPCYLRMAPFVVLKVLQHKLA